MLKIHKILIAGWFIMFVSMATMVYQIKTIPTVGVLDSQNLIAIYAQKLAKTNPNIQLTHDEFQKLAENIKEQVANYAKKHNLILLAKGAVWDNGCLVDYSKQILELLDVREHNAN